MITLDKKLEKVEMAKAHAEADRLIAGIFTSNEDNRGCSVGCDAYDIRELKSDDWDLDEGPYGFNYHAYVADYFGTSRWLEQLRDAIFEALPKKDRAAWHVDIAEALPVDVDFEPIEHLIRRDILLNVSLESIGEGEESWRVVCRDVVQAVADLHERALTEKVTTMEWEAARAVATRAAKCAARESERIARAGGKATLKAANAARAAQNAAQSAAARDVRELVDAADWAAVRAFDGIDVKAGCQTISEITLKHLREAGAPS